MTERYSDNLVQERLQLFDLLSKGADINSILESAYAHLQNPIILNDSSYQAVHSYGGELESDVYDQSRFGRYMKSDVLQTLYDEQFPDELLSASGAYLGYQPDRERYLLLCPIHVNHVMVAFLCVLPSSHEHTQEDVLYADLLADTISIVLQRDSTYTNSLTINQGFIINQILSGFFDTDQQLLTRLSIIDIAPADSYCLCCVEKRLDDSYFAYNQFTYQLKRMFPDALITIYQNKILVLLNGSKNVAALKQKQSELEPFLKFNNLKLTASNVFHQLKDLPVYYQQIIKLQKAQQEYGISSEPICSVQDYYFLYLACTEKSQQDLYAIIHPDITKLINHDKEHNSDYLATLKAYLFYRRNTSAAQTLHIHKTTFAYRMEKIEDIVGHGKIDEEETSASYMLSIQIYQLLEKINSPVHSYPFPIASDK